MKLERLVESFTFSDIEPLVAEYYPETKEYLDIYLETFGKLTCISPRDNNLIKFVDIEDDPNYVYVYDRNDSILFNISLESWLGCEIDYATMEHYSDNEIFIRCLNSMIYYRISAKEHDKELKKKDKN